MISYTLTLKDIDNTEQSEIQFSGDILADDYMSMLVELALVELTRRHTIPFATPPPGSAPDA